MALRLLHSSFSPEQNAPTVRISCKEFAWPHISQQHGENGPFRRSRVGGAFRVAWGVGWRPCGSILAFHLWRLTMSVLNMIRCSLRGSAFILLRSEEHTSELQSLRH